MIVLEFIDQSEQFTLLRFTLSMKMAYKREFIKYSFHNRWLLSTDWLMSDSFGFSSVHPARAKKRRSNNNKIAILNTIIPIFVCRFLNSLILLSALFYFFYFSAVGGTFYCSARRLCYSTVTFLQFFYCCFSVLCCSALVYWSLAYLHHSCFLWSDSQ